ncbi:hypothetical protein [Embleya sp. NBC_00896]|nr:hypothetical protein OG928_41010 [Embleya sp. NBC_00896]
MDVINGYAFLRPPSGGLEWETPLARVTLLPVGDNEGEGDSDNAPRPA